MSEYDDALQLIAHYKERIVALFYNVVTFWQLSKCAVWRGFTVLLSSLPSVDGKTKIFDDYEDEERCCLFVCVQSNENFETICDDVVVVTPSSSSN